MPLLLLLLVGCGLVLWKSHAPSQQFLPGLSPLLSGAHVQRGAASLLSGRSYLAGQFRGRDTALRLQLRRGRHQLGYLVLVMRTTGPRTLAGGDLDAHAADETTRQALFILSSNDLFLSVEDGWLKAMWQPVGLRTFPGSFAETKWRPILEAMHTVATSLDS